MTTVLESLNKALLEAMRDERVILLGEDILDPYGGAFKVTRGCSSAYPERSITTPISEAAIAGIANGLALAGKLPVAEVMFGDFLTLMADQLINHASKFRWMYNDTVRVPITIRAPMGGRRGYGPTHSQSIEKHFLGVPGLNVYAANSLSDPGALLTQAIFDDPDPSLFIEHKSLYTCQVRTPGVGAMVDTRVDQLDDRGLTRRIGFDGMKPACSVLTYGYNFELAIEVMTELAYERELFIEIVLFDQLSPHGSTKTLANELRSDKVVTFEEGVLSNGWGAEMISALSSVKTGLAVSRVASLALPIANSKSLEDQILPSKATLRTAIEKLTS